MRPYSPTRNPPEPASQPLRPSCRRGSRPEFRFRIPVLVFGSWIYPSPFYPSQFTPPGFAPADLTQEKTTK